jgi:transposase
MPPRDFIAYEAIIAGLKNGVSRKELSKKYNVSIDCIGKWAKEQGLSVSGYQERGKKGLQTRKNKLRQIQANNTN